MSSEPLDSATDWVAEHTRKYVETGGEDGYMWRGSRPAGEDRGARTG